MFGLTIIYARQARISRHFLVVRLYFRQVFSFSVHDLTLTLFFSGENNKLTNWRFFKYLCVRVPLYS